MKRLLLLLLAAALFIGGCRKAPPPEPEQNTPPVKPVKPVTLKVGHVGHDHHLALFVACDNADTLTGGGVTLKKVEDKKFYELFDNQQKIADVEIVKVGGGSKMPAALAQGVIDMGFGGVAAVVASADSGAPVKLISPLHSKGDMFVVKPDSPVNTWKDFVKAARAAEKPLRIGYKSPKAVAKLVFEDALRHEGITFSQDPSKTDVKVHLINTKGGGKLNTALSGDLVDGYVGNNPFPSIAVEKKMGKIVSDLEDLPPGNFLNHPCCCIAGNTTVMAEKAAAIEAMMVLFLQATDIINADLDKAVAAATRWIGTSETVERMSIPTSGYSMVQDDQWQGTMNKWIVAMNELGTFTGKLKGLAPTKACELAYDMTYLNRAKNRLGKTDK